MSAPATQRRLSAIMATDVVGYSRLMAADEAGTLAALQEHRRQVFDPATAKFGGRIVKLMGDGTLVEFPSVVDAVECALAIQNALSQSEGTIKLRVGINLGDVIIDGDDIYGDGVNIAARLEALAEPDGICISSIVHESLGNRINAEFCDAGEHEVKNIDRPIRVFSWPAVSEQSSNARAPKTGQKSKPAIAVLPFNNMSNDADQGFFADGLTEDIITALSRTRWYEVTARNSTFAYKGTSPDIREVGKALGAGYVLEGSVRKNSNRARITVQLIETATGNHVWADRYDRQVDDEFVIQDEIAQRVSTALLERVWQDVAKQIGNKSVDEYGAYDHAVTGIVYLHKIEPDGINTAVEHFQKAIDLDPDIALGHIGLGFCYLAQWGMWGDETGTALDKAYVCALKGQETAPDDPHSFRLLSRVYGAQGKFDEAWQCVERALAINPNDGDLIGNRGIYHLTAGEFDQAVEWLDKVLDLHADTPHTIDIMNTWRAIASYCMADYQAAIAYLNHVSGMVFVKHLWLAACHAQLDQQDEAARHSTEVLRIRPRFRLEHGGMWHLFKNKSDQQHIYDAMRKAELPE